MKRYLIASACLLSVAPLVLAASVSTTDPVGDEELVVLGGFPRTTLAGCHDAGIDVIDLRAATDGAALSIEMEVLDLSPRVATCSGVAMPMRLHRSQMLELIEPRPEYAFAHDIWITFDDEYGTACGHVQFPDLTFSAGCFGEAWFDGNRMAWSVPLAGLAAYWDWDNNLAQREYDFSARSFQPIASGWSSMGYVGVSDSASAPMLTT